MFGTEVQELSVPLKSACEPVKCRRLLHSFGMRRKKEVGTQEGICTHTNADMFLFKIPQQQTLQSVEYSPDSADGRLR